MKSKTLFEKLDINPNKPVLLVTYTESFENLIEATEEYCPYLEIDKMSKEDLIMLLESYGNCVINYHPEDYHQERAALIENFEMLKKYGLTDKDFDSLDFS